MAVRLIALDQSLLYSQRHAPKPLETAYSGHGHGGYGFAGFGGAAVVGDGSGSRSRGRSSRAVADSGGGSSHEVARCTSQASGSAFLW